VLRKIILKMFWDAGELPAFLFGVRSVFGNAVEFRGAGEAMVLRYAGMIR
jgi:hypothetical protein